MATDPWGVDDGFVDVDGTWHATNPETAAALRAAMGAAPDQTEPSAGRRIRIATAGSTEPLERPASLVLEDGSEVRVERALPPDLPIGYHDLHSDDGQPTRLIVTPGRCYIPPDLRTWLLVVQLYACRSRDSWGIGDVADLTRMAAWAREHGAGMLAVSPLHAPMPIDRVEPSPYFASSRRWHNPLHLRVDRVPGAEDDPDVRWLGGEARQLNADRLIDRDRVWMLKRRALERIWARSLPDPEFERWRRMQGEELDNYAIFCALAEHYGRGWRTWPAEHRHPAGTEVVSFASARAERVRFWAWLQYLLDHQLSRAAETLPLLTDLAVGVDPDGADAWIHQDLLALDCRIGAPPDTYNRRGQDWGLPPFVPWKLRDAGYEPLASQWRAALRAGGPGGGVRIDHVMALFRLFWLPPGGGPVHGAYVRYPGEELLAVLAVESVRAGALVVGEDLGTVEEDVRAALGEAGVLSYWLAWFVPWSPERYPAQALAAVTTHDLPTVAGAWTRADDADQLAAGIRPDTAAMDAMRQRLRDLSGRSADEPIEEIIVGVHARLARSPSMLVAATLEDALALRQRPNLPGTTSERPNWCLALPMPLEGALATPLLSRLANALTR